MADPTNPSLSKTRTVLLRWARNASVFGPSLDEKGARHHWVHLDPEVDDDMGRPDEITVTVRPGDHLNNTDENRAEKLGAFIIDAIDPKCLVMGREEWNVFAGVILDEIGT